MRAKLSGIICLILFLSVLKGCSTEVCGCVQFDTQVQFNFVDQEGHSLLNPDHPQAITERDVDLFFVESGHEVPAPGHFNIIHNKSTGRQYLQFSPNIEAEGSTPVAYLEFNNSERDTIKVSVHENDDITQVKKVWYNGDLRWDIDEDRDVNPARYIEINKELKE